MDSRRTAISRKKASRPLRAALYINAVHGRVLDFGCGKGRDIEELQELGYKVVGYDPHHRPAKPRGRFQTVLVTYVVNVLQPGPRNEALQKAWSYVKKGGRLIVTARTEAEIEREAEKGNWRPCREAGGGWITGANTYQKGYTLRQLQRVLRQLDGFKNMQTGPINAGGVMVILLKG
jgi:DNA phosphorothioation-associated putative methyltransferase